MKTINDGGDDDNEDDGGVVGDGSDDVQVHPFAIFWEKLLNHFKIDCVLDRRHAKNLIFA